MYQLAMRVSRDVPEASIIAKLVVKEGDSTSWPSPLAKRKRLENRPLFAMGKVLPFASPLYVPTRNEHF